MKKSSGSPSRTHGRGADAPVRQVPVKTGKEHPLRRWKGYVAAGVAVIILIVLIVPCQRRCGRPGVPGTYAYRWIVPGIPAGTVNRGPGDAKKGPVYSAGKKRLTPKFTERIRPTVPADKKEHGGKAYAEKKDAVKPPVGPDRSGKIETAERDAVKPDSRRDQGENRGTGEKPEVERFEKPKTYDFGTKIELVPAPRK